MDAALHFISGLPRAGSTLLSALLNQNPRFHANMTGPVASMVNALTRSMSMANNTSLSITDAKREAVLRGLFDAYYEDAGTGDVIFDTNRIWCARLPLLTSLFPRSRMICCVRDLAEVYDSIERLVRKNKFQPSGMFRFEPGGNVYTRVEHLADRGMVGHALGALREAFYGEHADHLLCLTYRTLTHDPQRALDAIYEFIGEPSFQHDFENIAFEASSFDWKLGTPGLHGVGRRIKAERRKPVLPPDLLRRFTGDAFWVDPARNPNSVKVV